MPHPLRMAIPECGLSDAGIEPQLDRDRRLSRHVVDHERAPGLLGVRFDEDVPVAGIEQAVAVERE